MRKLAIIALSCLTALAVTACAPTATSSLVLTGSVVSEPTVVSVPSLPGPTPDLQAGFTATPTAGPASSGASAAGSARKIWVRVSDSLVKAGDPVNAGQTIARLDATLLARQVDVAKAAEARSSADLAYIDSKIGDVATNRSDVASKTAELEKTIADLTTQRADVASKLDAARKAASLLPSQPGTPTIPPAQDPRVLIPQLEAALAKIDAGLAKANTALATLKTASTDLGTAASALQYTRDAAAALLDARSIGVKLAEQQLSLATITAPVDGTIIEIAGTGEVLAAGAPLVRIEPAGKARVETYVTADESERIAIGTQASVHTDSLGREIPAHVSAITQEYDFVPTTFSTTVIHLSRAFKVTVELDERTWLPPGTPADVTISVR